MSLRKEASTIHSQQEQRGHISINRGKLKKLWKRNGLKIAIICAFIVLPAFNNYNIQSQFIEVKNRTYIKGNQSILPMLKPHKGMSACLVIRDENTLPEWIAYHYIVGPLRHLVVSVDPGSKTSPMELLRKWNTTTDMDISVIDDIPRNTSLSPQKDMENYIIWQRKSVGRCICHHWENNRTWTLIIDVDEYITFNPPNITRSNNSYSELRKKLPQDLGSTTILQVIEDEKDNFPWAFNRCIYMPRVTFGDMEEQNLTKLYEGVPENFDPKKFYTLRFFRQGIPLGHYAWGKSFLDVSRLKKKDLQQVFHEYNFHFPLEECIGSKTRDRNNNPMLSESVFKINHYSGTKAAFYKRGGYGKNNSAWYAKKFEQMSKSNRYVSYETKSWLSNFVQEVGLAKAKDLLEGTGG